MTPRFDPSKVAVRRARPEDVPALEALNRLAYPELIPLGFVWRPEQLEQHLRVFPEGQRVALLDGAIAGAISLLVVDLGSGPLRPHTWEEITANGTFSNHDPRADTLYLADIYVHPEVRGRGVASALNAAQRELCRRRGLRRIVAGGRLGGYWQYADRMSAEEYARAVERGELRDPVLSCQLRDGFALRGILPGYLPDPRGLDHASCLEWQNPHYLQRSGRLSVTIA